MPLNTLRLNHQAHTHPNPRITFIKPLPLPLSPTPADHAIKSRADLTLRAIAAQCLPIMLTHHLSITTLEEHEPNREFIGRNFNNGEIIQLVLRARNSDGSAGGWLPLRMIQMVMMHELAHCVHMNHSRKFWEVRNLYAGEMKELFKAGYTGEGFWGKGQKLGGEGSGGLSGGFVGSEETKDLAVCGGTFRSRRRKRKVKGKEELTWKDKRDRRIEKKFGKNGLALGEDEDRRLALEINGRSALGSKPRVAQSKRGRELRAAAALARFEQAKTDAEDVKKETSDEEQTESESDYEDGDAGELDARGADGRRVVDGKGHGMIRVCDNEDENDVHVKEEMDELAEIDFNWSNEAQQVQFPKRSPEAEVADKADSTDNNSHNEDHPRDEQGATTSAKTEPPSPSAPLSTNVACPICSLSNSQLSTTCQACAHVLHPDRDPRHWQCTTDACQGSQYINSGDCGVCGICGARRAAGNEPDRSQEQPRLDLRAGSGHVAYA